MRSLGELVDELCTTSQKLWRVQDKVFQAEREKSPLAAQHVAMLVQLNAKRTSLINQINERDGIAPIVKITE